MVDVEWSIAAVTHLTLVVGGHTTHVVVHGWQHWYRLPGDVHSSEDHGSLRDTWQPGGQLIWRQMVQLQVYMVLLWTTASVIVHGLETYIAMHSV